MPKPWLASASKFFLGLALASLTACSTLPKKAYQQGWASWYGARFHGRKTASGERYNMNALTAAHPSLPFGSKIKVVDEKTGKSVVVRVNDRGPFAKGRIIDLSKAAARRIGIVRRGTARVVLYLVN